MIFNNRRGNVLLKSQKNKKRVTGMRKTLHKKHIKQRDVFTGALII
jgi:hypothetical protein